MAEKDEQGSEAPGRIIMEQLKDALCGVGVGLEDLAEVCEAADQAGGHAVKVVCVPVGLKNALEEMSGASRDQVVMVRVDEETSRTLNAWVETGAVKSRSEAAALFIGEGLKVRAAELEQLREGLSEVERAREKLRAKAKEVLGGEA